MAKSIHIYLKNNNNTNLIRVYVKLKVDLPQPVRILRPGSYKRQTHKLDVIISHHRHFKVTHLVRIVNAKGLNQASASVLLHLFIPRLFLIARYNLSYVPASSNFNYSGRRSVISGYLTRLLVWHRALYR